MSVYDWFYTSWITHLGGREKYGCWSWWSLLFRVDWAASEVFQQNVNPRLICFRWCSRVRVEANPLHNPLTKCLVWLPGFQKLPFVKWIDTPTRPFLIIFLHHGDPTCATSMRCNELQVPFARELESDDELLAPAEAEAPISPVTAAIARRNTETDKSEIYQWFKEHHFLILFNFYVWVVVWGHALKPHFALFGNQQFGVHPPPVAKASSIAEQCGRGA